MVHAIHNSQIEEAHKELTAERKILYALKRVPNVINRARVMRAVIALYGLDEKQNNA